MRAGTAAAAAAGPAMPQVAKKVELSYWTWADNPGHQKRIMDAVEDFNNTSKNVHVTADASSVTMEARQKVVVAFAAGTAPDLSGTVQTHVQDWYDTGILYPIDEFFNQWEDKDDFSNVFKDMKVKPDQPFLYLPWAVLPYVLYYRQDLFEKAKLDVPVLYDDFIAAAKALTDAPNVYGYALRGLDYYAVQPIEPIQRSAGVQFVDADGNVDIDSPASVDIIAKWLGMFTKDKSAQPTAINDRYPQLFALMEKGIGAMFIYGTHASPQLTTALGDKIQPAPIPKAGEKPYTLVNPEGNFITTSCKEKEAAWEFLAFMSQEKASLSLAVGRGMLPPRKSLGELPEVKDNRFFQTAFSQAEHWWHPPFEWKNWANYQDKIAPYWQEALRENITAEQFEQQAAKFLRGEA
jgi:multiple sugar transport system substrate-binding protein